MGKFLGSAAALALVAAPYVAAAQAAPAAQPELVVAAPAPPPEHFGAVVVPAGTMVRLMVLNEVNTSKAGPGDRFVLRVDENVVVGGAAVIPIGAKAVGEVTQVKPNAALGKAGSIGARLLYVEAGGQHVALTGEDSSKGIKGGDRVALAATAFGPFGLLARGSQGKLKAGHIFNGYVAEDRLFDPAAATFIPVEADGAAAVRQ
jgi:hypothetical protein